MRRFLGLALLAALTAGSAPARADEEPAKDAEALYEQGLALERAGKYEAAIKPLQDALDADPTLAKADRELGNCYVALGWKTQALQPYQDYLDSGADDDKIQAQLDSMNAEIEKLDALTRRAQLAGAGPWSLQGELGYAYGMNQGDYGHRFNRQGNANPFDYGYAIGQGFSFGLEPKFAINSHLAVGVEILPVITDYSGTGSATVSGESDDDATRVENLALPILLTVHTRAALGPNWRITCFAGFGGIYSQPYLETSTDTVTDATGSTGAAGSRGAYTEAVRYQRDYAPDLAFRGGLGLDLLLSAHCTGFLNASLLLAHQNPDTVNYSAVVTNSNGKVVGTSTAEETFSAEPPATQSVAAPVIPTSAAANSQASYSYSNGPTQWTTTVFYGPNGKLVPEKTQFNESVVLATGGGDDVVNIKVLAVTAGLRWEF